MKTKIYCPDIECDSCIKLISKALGNKKGVKEFTFTHEAVDIFHEDSVKPNELIDIIREKGFRADLQPFVRKTFRERFRDFRENKKKYEVEYMMIKYGLLAFFLLAILDVFAYFAVFKTIPNFISKYAWWLFYTNITVISIGAAVWHFKSYKTSVTTMMGMMIGMTFGMQTGMMLGTIIGATNGLFMGGMTGMLVASALGFYTGKCCGSMGVLEGLMAAVMGGPMGAMIGSMFFVDHILWFMPAYMILNLIILVGLSYLLFEEVVEHNLKIKKKAIDFTTFFSYCLIATTALTVLMIYGFKTGLAA